MKMSTIEDFELDEDEDEFERAIGNEPVGAFQTAEELAKLSTAKAFLERKKAEDEAEAERKKAEERKKRTDEAAKIKQTKEQKLAKKEAERDRELKEARALIAKQAAELEKVVKIANDATETVRQMTQNSTPSTTTTEKIKNLKTAAPVKETKGVAPLHFGILDFPQQAFFIRQTHTGYLLNLKDDQLILQEPNPNNRQAHLWHTQDGLLVNVVTELALNVENDRIESLTPVTLSKKKEGSSSQQWGYTSDGLIFIKSDISLVLGERNGKLMLVNASEDSARRYAQSWSFPTPS